MSILNYIWCVAAGYLVGCLNPSFFLAKINGFDIRDRGSGNAGASNALILFGKLKGILCALFDIAKAAVVIWVMGTLFPALRYAFAVTGVACIVGHVFPFYMGFRGGKGLACLGGMILAFDWRVFLIMLGIAIPLALLTKYICFVPITASVAFPVVYALMEKNTVGAAILGLMTVIILIKHIENIRRIFDGSEARISMLWNRSKEEDRLREKYEKTK